MLGGRGAGKTRAGAEWVRSRVEARVNPARRIALVGETYAAARAVMVDGVSGLLAISPPDMRPQFLPSRNLLIWPNGAEAQLFSAERPDALRGPQFDLAWSDELAKWRYDDACWDMLQFGLRLGERPQQMVSTTPRPTPLIKRLLAAPETVVTRAATTANAANLAPSFMAQIVARYVGTDLGRQELDGELREAYQLTLRAGGQSVDVWQSDKPHWLMRADARDTYRQTFPDAECWQLAVAQISQLAGAGAPLLIDLPINSPVNSPVNSAINSSMDEVSR